MRNYRRIWEMRKKINKSQKSLPLEGCAVSSLTELIIGEGAGKRKKPKIDASEAALHLRLIQHGQHIVAMYRKFFPEEFARDGIDYSSVERLLKSYDDFTQLVDARLFPVHDFSSNDMVWEEPEHALDTMFICYHQFAPFLWYQREPDLSRVERLIVSAAGYSGLEMRPPEGYRFSSDRLQELSWKRKGIISRLWLAAMALLGGTGNVWLDLDEDTLLASEPPDWSEGQVEWLAKEFKDAQRMSDEINEFFAWVGNDQEKVLQVTDLLRKAQIPDKPIKIKTRPGKPLAETLTELL
jgi:hypothetical protein